MACVIKQILLWRLLFIGYKIRNELLEYCIIKFCPHVKTYLVSTIQITPNFTAVLPLILCHNRPVVCTINIVTIVSYAARGVIYDRSVISIVTS